ncbi:hypothetical protein [Methylotuvimicrobium sp. KM1]|uniref:hypothetical protein n=1 Tax=Methylotuvimicrobium sp. KM1 TaxID=3377707 RepID=UPI00385050E9
MDATTAFLNRSEAAHYLHTLFDEQVQLGNVEDHHPNFYSLLVENQRNPKSASAVKVGYLRGNRLKYSRVDCLRINKQVMFTRTTLKEWFERHYLPVVIKKAA